MPAGPVPDPSQPSEPPRNRAERRGNGRKKAPAPHGHGKVQGARSTGPAPRQYQSRKSG